MARPKLGEGETQRLQLKISDEELEAIDDWRFGNRVASRSEAVRRLVQIGMRADVHVKEVAKATYSVTKKAVDLRTRLIGIKYAGSMSEYSKEVTLVIDELLDSLTDSIFDTNNLVVSMVEEMDALHDPKHITQVILDANEKRRVLAERLAEFRQGLREIREDHIRSTNEPSEKD